MTPKLKQVCKNLGIKYQEEGTSAKNSVESFLDAEFPPMDISFKTKSEIGGVFLLWNFKFVAAYDVKEQFPHDKYELHCFAHADGGNYLICVNLKDTKPDPDIFILDHYDPEQEIKPRDSLFGLLLQLEKE